MLFLLADSKKYKPGIEQDGSFEKANIVPIQVISLLPSITASESEHVTSTFVPGSTGNCVVVSIVLFHSVFSPVQSGAAKFVFDLFCCTHWILGLSPVDTFHEMYYLIMYYLIINHI